MRSWSKMPIICSWHAAIPAEAARLIARLAPNANVSEQLAKSLGKAARSTTVSDVFRVCSRVL